jgi:hypothetical protein
MDESRNDHLHLISGVVCLSRNSLIPNMGMLKRRIFKSAVGSISNSFSPCLSPSSVVFGLKTAGPSPKSVFLQPLTFFF